MKIAHRLTAISAAGATALALIGLVGLYGLSSVRDQFDILSSHAAPLKAASLQVAQSAELTANNLVSLSRAGNREEAAAYAEVTRQSIATMNQHSETLTKLDPKNPPDTGPYAESLDQVTTLVAQRLTSAESFEQAEVSSRESLANMVKVVDQLAGSVGFMSVQAGMAAGAAKRNLEEALVHERLAIEMSSRLKDMEVITAQTSGVTSKFRLGPLRERLTATTDRFEKIEVDRKAPDLLVQTKENIPALIRKFTDEKAGLFALRARVLADDSSARSQYRSVERGLLKQIRDSVKALDALDGDLRLQIVLEQNAINAASEMSLGPDSIVGLTSDLSIDAKRLQIELEALMRAEMSEVIEPTQKEVAKTLKTLGGMVGELLTSLNEMGEGAMAKSATEIIAALKAVEDYVQVVADSKEAALSANAALERQIGLVERIVVRERELSEQRTSSVTAELVQATEKVHTQVASSTWQIAAIGLLAIVGSILINTLMIRSIVSRLSQALSVAKSVSTGHLVKVPKSKQKDEISDLLGALETMVIMLDGSVQKIRSASVNVNQGSEEISRGNGELSERTEQQASHLTETASQMEQIKDDVNEGAAAASKANDLAQSACDAAAQGSEVVGKAVTTMRKIEEGAEQISKIISAIDSIAFQTNILALNAAVEAARAGEQGRGFAVVAAEVRTLASQSKESAAQIGKIIASNVEQVGVGSALVNDAGQNMEAILREVQRVSELIHEVSDSNQRQVDSISQINSAVSDLENMTQQNAALSEESSAEAVTLLAQARTLDEAVSVFSSDNSTDLESSEIPLPSEEGTPA